MPGSLVIADATRHQLGQLFNLRDLQGRSHSPALPSSSAPGGCSGESGAVSDRPGRSDDPTCYALRDMVGAAYQLAVGGRKGT